MWGKSFYILDNRFSSAITNNGTNHKQEKIPSRDTNSSAYSLSQNLTLGITRVCVVTVIVIVIVVRWVGISGKVIDWVAVVIRISIVTGRWCGGTRSIRSTTSRSTGVSIWVAVGVVCIAWREVVVAVGEVIIVTIVAVRVWSGTATGRCATSWIAISCVRVAVVVVVVVNWHY